MPAGGPDRIVVLPACARGCAWATYLLEEIAELRRTTLERQAEEHALAPTGDDD